MMFWLSGNAAVLMIERQKLKNSIIHQRFLQCAGMFMVLDIAFPYL